MTQCSILGHSLTPFAWCAHGIYGHSFHISGATLLASVGSRSSREGKLCSLLRNEHDLLDPEVSVSHGIHRFDPEGRYHLTASAEAVPPTNKQNDPCKEYRRKRSRLKHWRRHWVRACFSSVLDVMLQERNVFLVVGWIIVTGCKHPVFTLPEYNLSRRLLALACQWACILNGGEQPQAFP